MDKLDALETKIRRAADTIRKMREERDTIDKQLRLARDEARRAAAADDGPLREELDRLRQERQTIARRIEGMIDLIEEVEAVTQAEGV